MNTAYHIPLKLPVIVTKFIQPVTLDATQYFAQWKQYSPEQKLEHQAVLKTNAQTVATTFMADICRRFGFQVLQQVDPNVNNVVAAGNLATSNGKITTILVRLEGNPQSQMARLTVRSGDGNLANTVGKFIAAFITD